MRIGQLFPPAAPTPCRPSARPPPALLPRDAAAPRRGECRRAPPRRPNRQAAPSAPARIPSPQHRGRNPGRARTLRKPMRWACSRKHWRHMKMWYFRMRPVWLEHTRLHIQAERRAEPGQSGKRTTSAAAGWAGGWRAHHWRPPLADLVLWVKMRFGITGAVDPLTCLPPRAPLCKARASDER